MSNIIWFKDLAIADVPKVGGKNASLGEMYSNLVREGVSIPNGFALTAQAYQKFLEVNGLESKIRDVVKTLATKELTNHQDHGQKIRQLIRSAEIPEDMGAEIFESYQTLSKQFDSDNTDVAVRSSATAEDLPGASFAGQQASFLNIVGKENLLKAVKECFASLFTDRAISYREDQGFDHLNLPLCWNTENGPL